ncbi:MAG TPA: excinuclease ABC subunit UvrC [Magnetospirillaceae bacterium]|nr:excinuclease ABC subunit UvrC [Magnetospirillaceae bacterium]
MVESIASRSTDPKSSARGAPDSPGVYIMRDAGGSVLYVGKAKVLRNRLSSYFAGRKDAKTRLLVSRIASLEWILTGTEYEALLLENELIKRHAPRYNINLKDGKSYPVIRLTAEEWPRVFRTRRIVNDGSQYFGPFPSTEVIDSYLELVRRLFPLRRCRQMRRRDSPCTYFHIGRCSAPCAGRVSRQDYLAVVEKVRKLLAGETDELLASLRAQMATSASELRFEEAAWSRDAQKAIETFRGESRVVDFDPESRDYVAAALDGTLATFTVFAMRGGRLVGRDLFRARSFGTPEEVLLEFLTTYYSTERPPPPRVFLRNPCGLELAGEYFRRELSADVDLAAPDDRRHEASLAMAEHNAKDDLAKRRKETGDLEAMEELRRSLVLESLPVHIEGFDIAHLSGTDTVASLVYFLNGIPDRKNYRHFRIRTLEGRVDDCAALREAVGRRCTGLLNRGEDLPDLILVDGGLGQVNAARKVLDALEADVPLAGLAKRNEEIWRPGAEGPILLPRDSPALRLLAAVRDETHRFATGLNQRLRGRALNLAWLESAEGVGPARAARILKALGSLQAVAEAEASYIASAARVPEAAARNAREAARASQAARDSGEHKAETGGGD